MNERGFLEMAMRDLASNARRSFLQGVASAAVLGAAQRAGAAPSAREWVHIGTYTGDSSKGIYRVGFEPANGKLSEPELVARTTSPSFLEWHPSRRFLYAVNEVRKFNGQPGGSATAFAFDARGGLVTELNAVSTKGAGPCHLKCSPDGKALVVANYSAGSTATYTIAPDGRLSEAVSVTQHEGSGANPQRQKGPHAHGIAMWRYKGKLLTYVTDLGIDKVLAYELDTATAKLTPWPAQPAVPLAPGSGPRHVVVHPSAPLAFVINEMGNTLTSFRIDPKTSVWTQADSQSTIPKDYRGQSDTAELAVHPNGKFLYGSNRGHDSIVVFGIQPGTGKLTLKGYVSTEGKSPRSFAIHPSGKSLIAANQETGNLVSFAIEAATGMPRPAGHQVSLSKPVCVLF